MNSDIEKTSGRSDVLMGAVPGHKDLKVEVRVQELEHKGAANEGKGAAFSAGQGWAVRLLVLAAVWLIAGVYVGLRIDRGWVPADDGTLAQSALRVLQGQLPQRDFAEIYTGGLSVIHALAFRLLGVNLMSLRICVFLFFLAWIPAIYYIALRFTSALGAGLITLLAVSWSFPNYPAAMPSWYNLFFATFGAAALLRYLEVRTRRWLFVAGVCGGVSILIKVIGAYYIAGVLLFLAFLEQSDEEGELPGKNTWGYRGFSVSALFVFLITLIYVLHARMTGAELFHFVLPSAAVVGLILLGERKLAAGSTKRFGALLRSVIPFACGVLSPVVIFLTPYAASGGVGRFVSGVASSAVARSSDLAVIRPAPPQYAVWVLPLVGLLAAAMYWDKFQGIEVGVAIALGAVVIAVRATQSATILSRMWFSVVMLTPVVVVLGTAVVFAAKSLDERTKLQRRQVALLISLAATCSLVQYPFAAPIYLCYALPLTLLALVAIVATGKKQRGTYVLASVAGLYLTFGVASVIPLHLAELTHVVGHMDRLELPRGGIQIEGASFFQDLIHRLQQHSPNGLMFAANDCPELYFLSGLKNVARDDTGAPQDEILKAIRSDDLNLVVINEGPFFPRAKISPEVQAEIMKRFPNNKVIGIFHVFWKQ